MSGGRGGEGLRFIPSVDVLLNDPAVDRLIGETSRGEIKMALQRVLDAFREEVLSGRTVADETAGRRIVERLVEEVRSGRLSTLRRVVNATGIAIHTNLGRSLLGRRALDAIADVSGGYCSLEYDVEAGRRGSRHVHCERLVRLLTGADAALVVNNNAAAVTLVLNTFAEGREAIVSRGELVEIGGSFRMPDIMAKSGARMIEVGTTNKTRLGDYRAAVTERTGILVKVHRSNFDMTGFVDEADLEELASLSREVSVPLLYDQGSGLLVDLSRFGISGEPTVQEGIRAGAGIVCFSGDKLLGGPQAGIIAGTREAVDRIRRNPLTRTWRVDKFTLAALEATLKLYLDPDAALREIPVLRTLSVSPGELAERGKAILESLGARARECVTLAEVTAEVGGGALPSVSIPSIALAVAPEGGSPNALERAARGWTPPIVGRISRDRFLLDLRTVAEGEDPILTAFLESTL
jgi:L-seryl-tRNA(Ser) seleniumtransferase